MNAKTFNVGDKVRVVYMSDTVGALGTVVTYEQYVRGMKRTSCLEVPQQDNNRVPVRHKGSSTWYSYQEKKNVTTV